MFGKTVQFLNEKRIACGHRDRVETVSDYRKKKRPEELILQIGSVKDGTVSGDVLFRCAKEFIEEFSLRYQSNIHILDFSLHMDESTPHIHVKRVFFYTNKDGYKEPNQKRALEELGIERPNTEKKEGRYNNARMTLSKIERELFFDICKRHGIEIEQDVKEPGRQRMETDLFKLKCDLEEKELQIQEKELQIQEKELQIQEKELRIQNLESLAEKLRQIIASLKSGAFKVAQKVVAEHEKENREQTRSR